MRKIEQKMWDAIKNKVTTSLGNTAVEHHTTFDISYVFLHGHHIAEYRHISGKVSPNLDTFRCWPTATTRSRLRALGVNASIRNGKACINGVEI